ncbi:hypothetical protein [Bradyrhizobium sp. UFLA05-112]
MQREFVEDLGVDPEKPSSSQLLDGSRGGVISMTGAPRAGRFEIREASDDDARLEVYRFRYRVYVEQMQRRQKYADHVRKTVIEPLDASGTIYATHLDGRIIGTIRGNRFSDPHTDYYRTLYGVDDRFDYAASEMSLTTKLMFEPELQKSIHPIKLILHYARHFHYGNGCKIDFLDCNKPLIQFFCRFGYLDYRGWVFHREYGSVRPLCCPADQISRFKAVGSPLEPIARQFYGDNEFGGARLAAALERGAIASVTGTKPFADTGNTAEALDA